MSNDIINENVKETNSLENVPISERIALAKTELTSFIVNMQTTYELPSFLMDLIVTASLSDIRDCVSREIVHSKYEKGEVDQ